MYLAVDLGESRAVSIFFLLISCIYLTRVIIFMVGM